MLTLILLAFAFVLFSVSAYLTRGDLPRAFVAAGLALWVLATMLGGSEAHTLLR
jgi:hypothetical protein